MVVSIAIVSVIVLACASVVTLSAKSIVATAGSSNAGGGGSSAGSSPAAQSALARAAAERIADDVRLALSFTERTATAVTFTVPDRNADAAPETIRYAWSGAGGSTIFVGLTSYAIAPYTLTREYNGAAPVALAEDVQAFDLKYLSRTVGASPEPLPVLGP